MNDTTPLTPTSKESILESYSTWVIFLWFLLILSISSSLFLLCVCFLRRIFKDIQKNTLRVPHKQIPFNKKNNSHFQAMVVDKTQETFENNTFGINETIDDKKHDFPGLNQSELYENKEKIIEKMEMVSAIDINLADI